jgi:hypothetical protein
MVMFLHQPFTFPDSHQICSGTLHFASTGSRRRYPALKTTSGPWLSQYHQTEIIIHSNLIGKQPNYFILIHNNTIHF